MIRNPLMGWAVVLLLLPTLACGLAQQTPQPGAELEQITFDVQTATPTLTPILELFSAPTYTPDPNATATPLITRTVTLTPTGVIEVEETEESEEAIEEAPTSPPIPPTDTPVPDVPLAESLRGGVWSFETGFAEWGNPYGDVCPGAELAIGWSAFTSQDQYGSSCMNRTDWADNVHSGESAQEITFAYVGTEAGVFKTTRTIPGHRYTIEAFYKREFSTAIVAVSLGVDLTGGIDWQADTIEWFPWDQDIDETWAKTEVTITATGDIMTIFIKGAHPYPEPGGTLRIDSISVVDIGAE
ncbi:MAG: hypothetical protein AAF485_17415 [Chloroflexota bacterium]